MRNKWIQLLKGQIALWLAGKHTEPQKWIFSSVENREFNYNSKYLFLYVKEHFPQIEPYYVVNDEKKRRELEETYGACFIETKSVRGMCQACRAGVWFTSAGLPVYAFGSGKHHTIVNLWHGVPLKKIALAEEHASRFQRLYFKKIFSENYTCILTTSETLVPIMAESFGVDENKIKVWGQPRNDAILNGRTEDRKLPDRLSNLPDYKKAVLYAPTYREYGKTRLFPFPDMDQERLERWLKENRTLLCIRTHIEEKEETRPYTGKWVVDIGTDVVEDITEYLPAFDALITDYSSVYIDYLLLDRPIIFLPYDKEQYLKARGMNFSYDTVTPGAKPDSLENFLLELYHALYGAKDPYQQKRREVNSKINQVTEPCAEFICRQIYDIAGVGER